MSFNRSSPIAMAWAERYGRLSEHPAAIRTFLLDESTVAKHVFLQLYVSPDLPDRALHERWKRGTRVLADLATYTWGSRQKRAKFEAIAGDASVLAALQGAVARGSDVTLDMLAVLALDGSSESIDALLPHLDPALVEADVRLDLFRRLRTYAAPSPAIQAILAEIDVALAQRSAASPALALAPAIGLGPLTALWFDFRLGSRELNANRVPRIQGGIGVDSRSASWFHVWVSRVEPDVASVATSFTADAVISDRLGVGRCEAATLPRWFAVTATHLGVTLRAGKPRTNLRGAGRERLIAWLHGRDS